MTILPPTPPQGKFYVLIKNYIYDGQSMFGSWDFTQGRYWLSDGDLYTYEKIIYDYRDDAIFYTHDELTKALLKLVHSKNSILFGFIPNGNETEMVEYPYEYVSKCCRTGFDIIGGSNGGFICTKCGYQCELIWHKKIIKPSGNPFKVGDFVCSYININGVPSTIKKAKVLKLQSVWEDIQEQMIIRAIRCDSCDNDDGAQYTVHYKQCELIK